MSAPSLMVAGERVDGELIVEYALSFEAPSRETWWARYVTPHAPRLGTDMVLVVEESAGRRYRAGVGVISKVIDRWSDSYTEVEITASTPLVEWTGAE